MLREFTHLTEKLSDPEYLHLLLEPIMIWGLGIGVIAFLLSFLFGERKMQLVALIVIIVSAMAVVPYLQQRKKADERVVKLRGDVKEMIEESTERRRDSRGAYLVVAALAGLTILMGAHKGKPGLLAGVATAAAGAVVVVHGAWLHLKDAEIYHPNIRVAEIVKGEAERSPKKEKRGKPPAEQAGEGQTSQVSNWSARPVERRVKAARPR
ncbi:MAG: hypothetical protein ACI8XO_003983 [Verrucomicrobiales bacterium]|jgi:hypothetical protein